MSRLIRKFLQIAGISLILMEASCASFSTGTPSALSSLSTPQDLFLTNCEAYNASMTFFIQEYLDKKLTPQMITNINSVRSVVYPICSSPMPANLSSVLTTLTTGVAKLQAQQKQLTNPVVATPVK